MGIGRDGIGTGHHSERKGIDCQEGHDVFFLQVRAPSLVDEQITQILPVAKGGGGGRERGRKGEGEREEGGGREGEDHRGHTEQ